MTCPVCALKSCAADPHGRRVGADAALDDVADPEVVPQRHRVGTRVLAEARGHRVEPEAFEPHQVGDQLLGHAGGEEAVVLAGAERLEGQDDDGRTARLLRPAATGRGTRATPAGRREERDGEQRGQRANAQAAARGDVGTVRSVGGCRCARCPDNRPSSGFAFGVVGGRRVRRRLVPLEMRDVAAFRNGDTHRVPGAGIDVVAVEVASQAPGFEPHDRIGLWIEGLVAPKDGERRPNTPSARRHALQASLPRGTGGSPAAAGSREEPGSPGCDPIAPGCRLAMAQHGGSSPIAGWVDRSWHRCPSPVRPVDRDAATAQHRRTSQAEKARRGWQTSMTPV